MVRTGSMVLSLLLAILAAYTVMVAFAWFRQSSMLYFPARYNVEEMRRVGKGLALEPWPRGAGEYRGLLSATRPASVRGTVIVFHGNAGSAMDRTYYRAALEPLGFIVLLAEYPGYGARSGTASEKTITADALKTVELARKSFPDPLYLWGESLGAAVAASVARSLSGVKGLALVTPWADLPRLAQALYPFLPARFLIRERYDNIANLGNYGGPAAVLMADKDEIVPAAHTRALYEAVKEPKKLWIFEGAGHNSWPVMPNEAWWREASDFLSGGGPPPE